MPPEGVFKKVLIEAEVAEHTSIPRILSNLPGVPVEIIPRLDKAFIDQSGETEQVLVLAKQRGRFLSKCPGTMGHICCNYYVIHNGINCIFDCTYCFLKFYINNPYLCVYVNKEDLFQEIIDLKQTTSARTIRIGTGEYTDSLALDAITGETLDLLPFFIDHPEYMLELKTKSTQVENLFRFKPKADNIVIGWSLNSEKIIREEEHFAASLPDRLSAAQSCAAAGYKLAFHFDPVIYYPGWEADYQVVIDKLFAAINPDRIAWISLGTLRYHRDLKDQINRQHPESKIIYSETVFGADHKVRYFKPIRVKIYRHILQAIRTCSAEVPVYLCMELPDVWVRVFGSSPDFNDPDSLLFCR